MDASGNRSINNYAIVPDDRVQENFDFSGNGLIADTYNFTFRNVIDPSGIGRKVNISFVDDISSNRTYTYSDYVADVVTHADHVLAGSAMIARKPASGLSGARDMVDDLWDSGVLKTIYQGKPILYGTNDAETLFASQLNNLPGFPVSSLLEDYGQSKPAQGWPSFLRRQWHPQRRRQRRLSVWTRRCRQTVGRRRRPTVGPWRQQRPSDWHAALSPYDARTKYIAESWTCARLQLKLYSPPPSM